MIGAPAAIIDCFGMLNVEKIRRYFELGCEAKGLGRGRIQRIKKWDVLKPTPENSATKDWNRLFFLTALFHSFHMVSQVCACGGGEFRDSTREVPQPRPAH